MDEFSGPHFDVDLRATVADVVAVLLFLAGGGLAAWALYEWLAGMLGL